MAVSSKAFLIDAALGGKQTKSDKAASDLMCNIAFADITKVSVDDFAKQITLIDMSYFVAIKRAEFLSLKWNGRDKKIYAPNIVESTKWFNQLNFWVQKEILKYPAVNKRAEMLSYFIKLAKHLVDMNNLYSAMSIVSALQVECIYRLRLTWSGLGHRERTAYRRLEELFGQQDNCRLLREHTSAMRLPGIPYLGLYLSDLIYTNVAHPRINGQPTTVWVKKLNTIVDAIAHFQQSRFPHQVNDSIRAYLLAQSYIEELQKFLEDANFKMSLHREPPSIIDTAPPLTSTNGHSGDGARRGTSAVARITASSACKSAPLVVALSAGYSSDREHALGKAPSVNFKSAALVLSGNPEAEEAYTEAEVSCTKSAKPDTSPKLAFPPHPVGLLELTTAATTSAITTSKVGVADDISLLKAKKEAAGGVQSESDILTCDDVAILTAPKSRVTTHDQEVQVPNPHCPDFSTSTAGCLLCGRPSDALKSQQVESESDPSANTTRSLSETFNSLASSSGKETVVRLTSMESLIIPVLSTPPRLSLTQGHDIYSTVMAMANLTGFSQGSSSPTTNSRSDSGASFSPHSRIREDRTSQWPPTSFPFITALRPACVLCQGPVKRKTVGRLIPPGLINSSVFSDDGSNSPCPSATPTFPLSTAQPQQLHPRNASWKFFWAALVVMEGWASAYMVYFEAVSKKPICREDFATRRCQIQPFQQCPIDEGGVECPPSIGMARHRNGAVDETSFLLTHPGLHKTYRLRPIGPCGISTQEVVTGNSATPTPTSQQRDSRRLFFTLTRNNSVTTSNTTPTRTPLSSSALRNRGSSAPMLTANSPQGLTNASLLIPKVEDWVHALQATLDHLQS